MERRNNAPLGGIFLSLERVLLLACSVVLLVFALGCEEDKKVKEVHNEKERMEEEEESPAHNFELAYDILIKEKDMEEDQRVSIQRLNRNYMLMETDITHHGGIFYLIDVQEKEMTELFREGEPEIKEVTRDSITFLLQRHNGPAGQFFPYLLHVDMETGKAEEKPYYASLDETMEIGAGQPGLNGAGFTLEKIEADDETLIFRLGETEDIFIAGGMVSPKIELSSCSRMHRKLDTEKALGITFKETVLKKSDLEDNIKEHPLVEDVYVEEYRDGLDAYNVFVALEFSEEIQYNCEFDKDEDETVSDLYISF